MAKAKFASLKADMIKTTATKRSVIIGPDGKFLKVWAFPGKAA